MQYPDGSHTPIVLTLNSAAMSPGAVRKCVQNTQTTQLMSRLQTLMRAAQKDDDFVGIDCTTVGEDNVLALRHNSVGWIFIDDSHLMGTNAVVGIVDRDSLQKFFASCSLKDWKVRYRGSEDKHYLGPGFLKRSLSVS